MGRWLSPDPAGAAAVDLTNPQSLNRYAYVMNNPTTLIDPSGLGPVGPCPLVNDIAPRGCGNGPNDFGGYSVDGFSVSNGLGQATLAGGWGVQCPGNDCSGIQALQGPGGSTIVQQWVPPQYWSGSDSGIFTFGVQTGYWQTIGTWSSDALQGLSAFAQTVPYSAAITASFPVGRLAQTLLPRVCGSQPQVP
jgi:hypothetical protein